MLHVIGGASPVDARPFEFVERKGRGHPDTLVDAIADEISRRYSRYCLEKFGAICNHWIDKCILIGGESRFEFGQSAMLQPIRLIVIGKATTAVGRSVVPLEEIAREGAIAVIEQVVASFDKDHDLKVEVRTNDYQGAGRPAAWYKPSVVQRSPSREDLANDAVICAGFAPFSATEEVTFRLAEMFFDDRMRRLRPYIGSDIKVLSQRIGEQLDITACVPFVARETSSRAFYDERLEEIREDMILAAGEILSSRGRSCHVRVHLNTRDDEQTVYMSHYGSCLDTGDVGAVGRGNRGSGLITPARPMSIEAPSGKNPKYHSGKILDIAAFNLAREIAAATGRTAEVIISTQTGLPLANPFAVVVHLEGEVGDDLEGRVKEIGRSALSSIQEITGSFVAA